MDFKGLSGLTGVLALAVLMVSGTHSAVGSEGKKRLIETGPNERRWMSEEEVLSLSKSVHASGRCGGFFDVTDFADEEASPLTFVGAFDDRVPRQQAIVDPLLAEVSAARLSQAVQTLSAYKNRVYKSPTGRDSAQWIKQQFTAIAAGRTDISIEEFAHTFVQPSIIARIAGTGPLAAERVIIGAHQDSINQAGSSLAAPGADDDASGTSTVLEAFRLVVQSGFRPNRTLEFMAFAGEEGGLLGSQDIAKKYKTMKIPVFAMVQFDMTMYPGQSSSMTLMQDYVHPGLTKFTEMLIDTYVRAPWGTDQCGYGCSDHASWNKAGYPSVMPFESPMGKDNPAIHTTRDLLSQLDTAFGVQFAKLAVAFAVELSSDP